MVLKIVQYAAVNIQRVARKTRPANIPSSIGSSSEFEGLIACKRYRKI